jgi:hypothetical protein
MVRDPESSRYPLRQTGTRETLIWQLLRAKGFIPLWTSPFHGALLWPDYINYPLSSPTHPAL